MGVMERGVASKCIGININSNRSSVFIRTPENKDT
jgi:hypothetical protein